MTRRTYLHVTMARRLQIIREATPREASRLVSGDAFSAA
jgi:hypothetical protein